MSDSKEIDSSKIEFIERNGKRIQKGYGSSGKIFVAKYLGNLVAIKEPHFMSQYDDYNKEMEKDIQKECSILEKLNHENILKYYGFCRIENRFCMVTKYLNEGNLVDFLDDCVSKKKEVSYIEKINIILDISRGIEYMHSKGVLNRDIKTNNVLLTKKRRAVICDFGFARNFSSARLFSKAGTGLFIAPELLESDVVHTTECDIYSLGVVMWCVLSETSFPSVYKNHVYLTPKFKDKGMIKVVELMKVACKRNPKDRISIGDLVRGLERAKFLIGKTLSSVEKIRRFFGINNSNSYQQKLYYPIFIRVSSPWKGVSMQIFVGWNDTLTVYKDIIYKKTGIIPKNQRIVHCGKQLNDDKMFPQIPKETTIWVCVVPFEIRENTYQIFARIIDGRHLALHVHENDTLADYKLQIFKITGILPEGMRIIFAGKALKNDKMFPQIPKETTIHVVTRLKGGDPMK